ncbi:hypothetical protein PAL_GLEAN10007749 [Pteropus alecto]|uniref:Uncharacterized protein n=1 Tax=Pteropus alecto TaxID=9402 RepID=L5KFJ2_PTEAL|nr:hypothetical protein PAL_GLEAN10007749 [Pteropus alecto]
MRTVGRAFFLLAERRQHGECPCCGLRVWWPWSNTTVWPGKRRQVAVPSGS